MAPSSTANATRRMPAYHQWRSSRRAMIAYCSRSISPQGLADVVHVVWRELGVDRQTENFAGQQFGRRQRTTPLPILGVRRLEMHRQRIVHVRPDAVISQVRLQRVTFRRAHDEQVEDA